MKLSPVLAILPLLLLSSAGAAQKGADLVKAQALASVSAIAPGEPFRVGVLFDIKPQWHIYWINPGEAGLPTRVEFELPEGFTASELEFPVPVQFNQPGNIIGYGYMDQAMLLATITPPKDLKPGTSVSIRVKPGWLVCHDVCLPGQAELTIELPVSAKSQQASAEVFQEWEAKLPRESDDLLKAIRRAPITSDQGRSLGFLYDLVWKQRPTKVEWYPVPGGNLALKDVSVTTEGDTTTLGFTVRKLAGDGPKQDSFQSLLVLTLEDGQRIGLNFPIPIELAGT